MSQKKLAKKLRKQHAETFADFLDELTPEQLERLVCKPNYFKARFVASVVKVEAERSGEGK